MFGKLFAQTVSMCIEKVLAYSAINVRHTCQKALKQGGAGGGVDLDREVSHIKCQW